jgi:elongation factor Ts
MVLVSCETDFVAMNKDFVEFAEIIASAALANKPANAEELMKISVDGTLIEDLHKDILAKFSEKIEIAELQIITSEGYVGTYIHGGAKLGVMVEMTADGLNDDAKSLVKDIAMQVAAMNPRFSHTSEVDEVTLAKEKEIYTQSAIDSGKPAEIAARIAEGKMNKFYEENCLVEMDFVKDPKKKIKDVVADIAKLSGKEINVKQFVRVAIGG